MFRNVQVASGIAGVVPSVPCSCRVFGVTVVGEDVEARRFGVDAPIRSYTHLEVQWAASVPPFQRDRDHPIRRGEAEFPKIIFFAGAFAAHFLGGVVWKSGDRRNTGYPDVNKSRPTSYNKIGIWNFCIKDECVPYHDSDPAKVVAAADGGVVAAPGGDLERRSMVREFPMCWIYLEDHPS